jgi:hypothetical protein
VFLLGAEFTKAYANRHGSKQDRPVAETSEPSGGQPQVAAAGR